MSIFASVGRIFPDSPSEGSPSPGKLGWVTSSRGCFPPPGAGPSPAMRSSDGNISSAPTGGSASCSTNAALSAAHVLHGTDRQSVHAGFIHTGTASPTKTDRQSVHAGLIHTSTSSPTSICGWSSTERSFSPPHSLIKYKAFLYGRHRKRVMKTKRLWVRGSYCVNHELVKKGGSWEGCKFHYCLSPWKGLCLQVL